MYLFKLLENSFDNLNSRVKLELFLLPLFLIFLIWNLFFTIEHLEHKNDSFTNKIDIYNVKMKETFVKIIEDIEDFCKQNNILIEEIKVQNKSLKLLVKASLKEQLYLIEYIEKYNSFSKIDLLKNRDESLFLAINFDKIYSKPKIELKSRIAKLDIQQNDFTLFAIVNKKVYINKKWLRLNDSIFSFKVIQINKDSVVLANKYKKIVLRLDKNENIQ